MTTTSAPSMVSFTLEELKGLGPAENLPAKQQTTGGASTTSHEPTATQSSMPKSRTDLLGVMDELELEPGPSVSDSEDEDNAAPKPLNISEKRKVQNSKFSEW